MNDVQAADQDTPPLRGHRSALTLLFLAFMLSITDRMILSILFPDIKAEFGLSDTELGLLGGLSFALFYGVLGLPIAKLSDRYSRKYIILASLVIFSIMTTLSGFAAGFVMLLLFRAGVGVGEAGVSPASHSLVADYFPTRRRAFAMSILIMGGNVGMLVGFIGGGLVAQTYGWRAALLAVGVPGLLLALVFWRIFKDPPRGTFERQKPLPPPPILETVRAIWTNPAMRHVFVGSVLMGINGYGLTQWIPTLFIRLHDVSQSQAGLIMAGLFGVLGGIGTLVAGKWFDRLSKHSFEHAVRLIAIAPVLGWPFAVMAFLATDLTSALLLFLIPGFVYNFFLGPSVALIQTLSPVNMRAVTAAIKMLLFNLIGYGLGPLLVGALSDGLEPAYGDRSIGVALAIVSLFTLWAGVHFWLCGRAMTRLNAGQADAREPY